MFTELQGKTIFNQAKDYAFDYLDHLYERNVYPSKQALENLKHFDQDLPDNPTSTEEVLTLLHQHGSPATVTQAGGRYFGFVNGSSVPAGLAAKWLSDIWDQNTAMNVLSPLISRLETVVESWLNDLFNLPSHTAAGFVSGTSAATFCGLAAARFRIYERQDWDINEKGMNGAPKIRVVTGRDVHSTVLKAISLLGFGKENIEWVETDDQGRIIANQVPELDENTLLILQAGNVNSGSFDPFEEICERAKKAGSWVHIDGAFGLWTNASKELKHLTKGTENANSWAVDGHKTLNTPYDCGIVLCEDRDALVSALHMTGSYIILSESRDGMLYTPEMSRRARVVELWAVMKYLGRDGIDLLVNGLHERALQFAQELKSQNFQVLNNVVFNQVLVACDTDELTVKTLEQIQELRECWCGGAIWRNQKVIRVSVCSWATTKEDVSCSVRSFVKGREIAIAKKTGGK